jgi:hypothetical protein
MRKNWLVLMLVLLVGAGAVVTAQPAADQPATGTNESRAFGGDDDDGMDLGWIGLLGLAGLLGLRGRATDRTEYASTRQSTNPAR